MGKYKAMTVIEDKDGKEICRQGDFVTLIDSVGTTVSGVIDKVDYEDGSKTLFFEGWNVKVVLDYIDKIVKGEDDDDE